MKISWETRASCVPGGRSVLQVRVLVSESTVPSHIVFSFTVWHWVFSHNRWWRQGSKFVFIALKDLGQWTKYRGLFSLLEPDFKVDEPSVFSLLIESAKVNFARFGNLWQILKIKASKPIAVIVFSVSALISLGKYMEISSYFKRLSAVQLSEHSAITQNVVFKTKILTTPSHWHKSWDLHIPK